MCNMNNDFHIIVGKNKKIGNYVKTNGRTIKCSIVIGMCHMNNDFHTIVGKTKKQVIMSRRMEEQSNVSLH
jgi:hypothetical protein